MRRDLEVFFGLQILSFVVAMLSFKMIDVRWQAALVAGTGFVVVGIWMVLRTLRWTNRFRFVSFYTARIHLYIFSLPMLLVRWRYKDVDFSQINLMGIPGPVVHRWAEMFFLVLVAGTLIDWIRIRRSGALKPSAR